MKKKTEVYQKLLWAEQEKESSTTGNKAKESVHDEIIMEGQQFLFHELQNFFRTMRNEEKDFILILQKYISIFNTWEIPPGIYEVSHINNVSCISARANISIYLIAKKLH